MAIPKIIFKPMSLEKNIERLMWAYMYANNDDLDVKDCAIEQYGDLDKIDEDKSLEEKIIEIVTKRYNNKYSSIENAVNRYNKQWKSYNDKYFTMLSQYLGVEWPSDKLVIEAEVGIIPVYPRFLDTFSFQLDIGIKDENLVRICAHETLHFLWFEKWKQMHPETEINGDEVPYLVWKYSEMVTDPVLNNEPFSSVFNFKEVGYDSFYEIYDGDELVMDKLRNLYSENIPIEEKIDRGFKYIERLENKSKKL